MEKEIKGKDEKAIRYLTENVHYRAVELTRKADEKDERVFDISFSSETPVERFFGVEILDHGKKSVRLERLQTSGKLLKNHDMDMELGDVLEPEIIDRKGKARIRFGLSPQAEIEYQEVINNYKKNISVGYKIHEVKQEKKGGDDKIPIYRAIDWEPVEISIVTIPADVSVGINRTWEFHDEISRSKEEVVKKMEITNEVKTQFLDEGRKEEQKRVQEIMRIGKENNMADIAENYIATGGSTEEFKRVVELLKEKWNAKPVDTVDPIIGMSEKEIKRYSIVRAIRNLSELKPLDGLEREASEAVAKLCRKETKGFFIPEDVMRRTLQVTDATKGGFLVGTDVLVGSMIELLRNKPKVAQLGATTLSGLVGNIAIPRVAGGAIAYWLPEDGNVPMTSQGFGQMALTPHRLVGDTAYTKELVMQTTLDVEAFVRNDLMTVLAIAKDLAAINGSGTAGEPLGILNTSGRGTVTFAGAATWGRVISFETQVASANVEEGIMAYLTTPAVRGRWKEIPKVSGTADFLWASNDSPVNGYRAEVTNQVPGNRVLFGAWNNIIFADWAGIDVVVDPYSLKKLGQIEITITLGCDVGVRHGAAFCASTDAGNQ